MSEYLVVLTNPARKEKNSLWFENSVDKYDDAYGYVFHINPEIPQERKRHNYRYKKILKIYLQGRGGNERYTTQPKF